MKVAITGSSGLIGKSLTQSLQARGDQPIALKRGQDWAWGDGDKGDWVNPASLQGVDALVHLAGENVGEGRWTSPKKKLIEGSRIRSTQAFARTLAQMDQSTRPRVFLCASAIGYFGSRGSQVLTETDGPGDTFLAKVCAEWEAAANPARDAGVRVVHARLAMVLTEKGGAIPKVLPIFKMGGGGVVGNGDQYWSWITLDDVIKAMLFLLDSPEISGPVNVASPTPVTNRQFTAALGEALHRPTMIPVPAFAVRLALGQMADELLLASTRVEPAVLKANGFVFNHPDIQSAMAHVVK